MSCGWRFVRRSWFYGFVPIITICAVSKQLHQQLAKEVNLDLYSESQFNDEKTQFSNEKTQLTNRKLNSDKDWELIYFKEKLIEQIAILLSIPPGKE